MSWINNNFDQLVALLAVAIILTVGRSKILPSVKRHSWLMWVAWIVTGACGLVLGWALFGLVRWATALGSVAGSTLGAVGSLIALWLGWHGVYLVVAMIRDLADKTPDEDARKAALWVPTFLPAGIAGVWGVVSHPTGLGTGLTAAVMAAITIVYTSRIMKAVLEGKTAVKAWKWFAAAVCLLSGLVTIPLVAYVNTFAAAHLPSKWMAGIAILEGVFGIALLLAALKDIADKIPDAYVRAFLRIGVPMLVVSGAVAVAFATNHISDGTGILTGTMK
jgi:hypothetical protein